MAESLKDTQLKFLKWAGITMVSVIILLVGAAYANLRDTKADKATVESLQTDVRMLLMLHLNNSNDPTGELRRKYGQFNK